MTSAETRVPLFIDAYAVHDSRAMRSLVWGVTNGREGVFQASHLRISALATPGAEIACAPGVFVALNRGVGGDYESYLDKFATEIRKPVTATGTAARTDLVVARVKNPYPGGSGTGPGGGNWPEPADRANGPYWDIDVLEGVTSGIQSPLTVYPTLTGIPLARITRPANTGIVQQSHLTELRSLVDLGGERITIINNPPPAPPAPTPATPPPPIAAETYTNAKEFPTASTFSHLTTAWTTWPAGASFDVPIPSWAVEVDIMGSFTPQYTDDLWGEARLSFGGTAGPSTFFDENVPGSPWQRLNLPLLGTYVIPTTQRGTVVPVSLQLRNLDPPNSPGDLVTRRGVYLSVWLNFKRYPY